MRSLLNVLAILIATLLAAFFALVGQHKAFAPLAELAQHRVWTLALPQNAVLIALLALIGLVAWNQQKPTGENI